MSWLLTNRIVKGWANKPIAIIWCLLIIAVITLPFYVTSPYLLHVAILMMIGIIMVTGLRLQLITGRINAGICGFQAIGAYVAALLSLRLGVNPFLTMLMGGIVTAIVALIFGYIVLRVGGVYFIFLTIVLNMAIVQYIMWDYQHTGGGAGLWSIPGFAIGGFEFGSDKIPYYYLALFLTILTLLVFYAITNTRPGLTFRAIGENEVLSGHVGINNTRYRVIAFIISSFFVGIAGAYMIHYVHIVFPKDYGPLYSLYPLVYHYVGGPGFVGLLLGPIFIIGISEALRLSSILQPIFWGSVVILTLIFLRGGLEGVPSLLIRTFRKLAARRALDRGSLGS
jgi:branched-chain amino acid transport system permease protein